MHQQALYLTRRGARRKVWSVPSRSEHHTRCFLMGRLLSSCAIHFCSRPGFYFERSCGHQLLLASQSPSLLWLSYLLHYVPAERKFPHHTFRHSVYQLLSHLCHRLWSNFEFLEHFPLQFTQNTFPRPLTQSFSSFSVAFLYHPGVQHLVWLTSSSCLSRIKSARESHQLCMEGLEWSIFQ